MIVWHIHNIDIIKCPNNDCPKYIYLYNTKVTEKDEDTSRRKCFKICKENVLPTDLHTFRRTFEAYRYRM